MSPLPPSSPPSQKRGGRQIAALWLARLPSELLQERTEEPLAQTAIVLDDSVTRKRAFTPRGVTRIVDCTDDLRAVGVHPPMRTLDAQRYAPAMQVEILRDQEIEARLQALAEMLLRVTPVVEPGRALGPHQNALFLDLTGLWGDVRTHLASAQKLLAEQRHMAKIAVAPGQRLALALARDPHGPPLRVVTAQDRSAAIERLPLAALGLDPDLVETLRELGVTTGGALNRLRQKNLAPRLHAEAKTTLALLSGHDTRPLKSISPPDDILEKVLVDFGVRDVEPLLFLARPLADRIIARLQARQEKLGEATIRMRLQRPISEEERFFNIALPLVFPEPIDRASALVQAFAARLNRHGIRDETGAPVPDPEVVELAIEVARSGRIVASQQDAFSLGGAPPAALRALLGELWAELGEGAVGRLVVENTLLPERMTTLQWTDATPRPLERSPLAAARDQCREGTFMAAWPWPLKLWSTPKRLAQMPERHLSFTESPLALLEGEVERSDGAEIPFRRHYCSLRFSDGRRALAFVDDELEDIWVQGWFD